MKNKLHSILFCIGALVFIFSGCQKQDPLAATSASSTKASNTADENRKNKDEGNDKSIGHTFDNTFTK